MKFSVSLSYVLLPFCMVCSLPAQATSQQTSTSQNAPVTASRDAEMHELRTEIDRISARLAVLEAESSGNAGDVAGSVGNTPAVAASPGVPGAGLVKSGPATRAVGPVGTGAVVTTASVPAESTSDGATTARAVQTPPVLTSADRPTLDFFRGTTLNFAVDGYYGYNFNQPVGRVNLLRAYTVSSNSFSVSQADVVVERLPTPESRLGGRIDLQFGQATETLQGSSLNEQRPQVWRNVFQAYGSYLAPVGRGLQLDFGKFASALGNEGNYTKDQIAYSRAFGYNYLPFYHMGLRATYQLSPKVGVAYWLVNGINDTEDLNGYKSQGFLLTLKPASTVQWNVNYYFGQEGRDTPLTLNPGVPSPPNQPGLPLSNISPALNGREHIFDTYATWQATPKLELLGETDFVVDRNVTEQQPGRVVIAEFAGKYQMTRSWYVGWRGEYFDDRGGLFSGRTQALKEGTLVLNHDFGTGFQTKLEYRRDWSNQRYFLSDTVGGLEHAQPTATVGLVYWWGMKQGAW